jgi:hypothetical protein
MPEHLIPNGIEDRPITDREVNVLIDHLTALIQLIDTLILYRPQGEPNPDTRFYIRYSMRLAIARIMNYANRHDLQLNNF